MKKIVIFFLVIFSCQENISKDTKSKNSKKEEIEYKQKENSTAIVIDVSLSMISKEFKPNRLANIKHLVREIINKKEDNQKISLIIFAYNSFLLCPLTSDKSELLKKLNKIDEETWRSLEWGTNFESAIWNALYSLKNAPDYKTIIIFSDGISINIDSKIKPKTFQKELIANNVKTSCIVLASDDIALLPSREDKNGKLIFEEFRAPVVDSTLYKLSKNTNGLYVRLYNNNDVSKFDVNTFFINQKKINQSKIDSIEYKKYNFKEKFESIEVLNQNLKSKFE